MVQCLLPVQRGLDVDAQILLHLSLTDIFPDSRRTEGQLKLTFVISGCGILQACGCFRSHISVALSHRIVQTRASFLNPRRNTDSTVMSPPSSTALSIAFSAEDL